MHFDVTIIGAGITGSAIAFELSKYQLKVAVLEKENDVSMKTTKANSGIIHAGYDPKPGSLMARLNVEGSQLTHDLYPLLNFHYKQIGSLVIGSTEEEHQVINDLFERGLKNGVKDLHILKTSAEVHQYDHNLASNIDYALYAPTAGIISPWELCLALAYTATINGVDFILNCEVKDITKNDKGFLISTSKGNYESTYVINCAGTHADDIYKLVLKDRKNDSFTILPCKGEYYLLDKDQGSLMNHVIFQTPTKLGKGVLVSPTVHGNLIVGPNADYEDATKDDTCTLQTSLDFVKASSMKSSANLFFGANIRNFSGIRATLKDQDDFLIEESKIVPHFINFAGIKSPGLSCGPAFGKEAVRLLEKAGLSFREKKEFHYYRLPTFFSNMTLEEKKQAIISNPLYGQVICRCETVTEAEIINAINAPIGATTIDGIKRRTNAGMGRCQGGFCGPKVFQLLMDELKLNYDQVYQDRDGSEVVVCKTKGEK